MDAHRQFSDHEKKYCRQNPFRRFFVGRFMQEITRFVKQAGYDSLLEVGCGEGFVLQALGQTEEDWEKKKIVGCDIDKEAIKKARLRLGDEVSLQLADIYNLPYQAGEFKLILCLEVLEHLEYPEKAVRELRRVCCQKLIVTVPHEPWFRLGNFFSGRYLARFGHHPDHLQSFNPATLRSILKESFSPIKILSVFPWLVAVANPA